ncbi:MAG: hypothetical protein K8R54_11250 [Bacteroidales bacterium]|nr:hypothetical protein [Bacteroidales bacterium]
MKKNIELRKGIFRRFYIKGTFIALCFTFIACSSTKNVTDNDNKKTEISSFSFLGGCSTGGIIEDTETDAVSGATTMKYNTGVHSEISIKGRLLETGLDYIAFKQAFTYLDPAQSIDGVRDFSFHQLRMPLTYNFQLFKNNENRALLFLKAGLSIGYTFSETITDKGTLPEYSMNNFNFAPTVGLATYPIRINNKFDLGLYLDIFRGAVIYEDIYNKEMGFLSNLKFGLSVKFLNN